MGKLVETFMYFYVGCQWLTRFEEHGPDSFVQLRYYRDLGVHIDAIL